MGFFLFISCLFHCATWEVTVPTHYAAIKTVVCWEKLFAGRKALICSFCQFLGIGKYPNHGWFLATNVKCPSGKNSWKCLAVHIQEPAWASACSPLHLAQISGWWTPKSSTTQILTSASSFQTSSSASSENDPYEELFLWTHGSLPTTPWTAAGLRKWGRREWSGGGDPALQVLAHKDTLLTNEKFWSPILNHWELEICHVGSIYTREIGKCYKLECPPSPKVSQLASILLG